MVITDERLRLGDLPVWEGVQERPGYETLPFALMRERGVVRLDTKAASIKPVIERYGAGEYSFISTPPGLSEWGTRRGEENFQRLARWAGRLDGKTVLEIGAGTLYLAERVTRELGAKRFIACDPAITQASPDARVEVVRDYFSFDRFRREPVDLIISMANLEHLPDPFEHLAQARALLESTGGRMFVMIPECTRGFKEGDWGVFIHEHLSYFTRASFEAAAAEAGLGVLHADQTSGTLAVLLGPGGTVAAPRASEDFATLEAIGAALDRSLEQARARLRCPEGRRIGVHGCTAGLNNILALTGLGSQAGLHLFDGDRAKAGKYLPAFDRPIAASSDASYKSMDEWIVAAPDFFDEIRAFAMKTHGIPAERIGRLTTP